MPSRRASSNEAKLALALSCLTISLLIGEFVCRQIWGEPVWLDRRVVFFSEDTWRTDDQGAIRYAPNREIRSLAIYGRHVEYDARFPTNDLGLVDTRDYTNVDRTQKTRRIALVGDSFTAGFHGGAPWVPMLRDRAEVRDPAVEIFNLGVSASSALQLHARLLSLEDELAFNEVVVLLITNDFDRRVWRPHQSKGRHFLCPLQKPLKKCLSRPSRMLIIPDDAQSVSELFDIARRKQLIVAPDTSWQWLSRHSFVVSRIEWLRNPPTPRGSRISATRPARVREWLALMREDFAPLDVTILHLPEKAELKRGRLNVDIEADVIAAGFRFISLLDRCDLLAEDYYPIDNHPTAAGYDKILRCVGQELELL